MTWPKGLILETPVAGMLLGMAGLGALCGRQSCPSREWTRQVCHGTAQGQTHLLDLQVDLQVGHLMPAQPLEQARLVVQQSLGCWHLGHDKGNVMGRGRCWYEFASSKA